MEEEEHELKNMNPKSMDEREADIEEREFQTVLMKKQKYKLLFFGLAGLVVIGIIGGLVM